jgi:hypothetical protein
MVLPTTDFSLAIVITICSGPPESNCRIIQCYPFREYNFVSNLQLVTLVPFTLSAQSSGTSRQLSVLFEGLHRNQRTSSGDAKALFQNKTRILSTGPQRSDQIGRQI